MAKKSMASLPCSNIRRRLAEAITETYVSKSRGQLTEKQADALARNIARLADQTFKTCKRR
jgi:regulator of replication initiation timing